MYLRSNLSLKWKLVRLPLKKINAAADIDLVPDHVFNTTVIGGFQQQGHQYITDGLWCCSYQNRWVYWARNSVSHRILRIQDSCGGYHTGFKAAAAIDAYIHDHRTGLMLLTISSETTTGVLPHRHSRPYCYIACFNCLASGIFGSITEVQPSADIILQTFKPVYAVIKDLYACTHGQGCTCCIFSHNTCTNDDDLCWRNAADASTNTLCHDWHYWGTARLSASQHCQRFHSCSLTIGLWPLASLRFSKLSAVILLAIIFSSISFFITARWMGR